MTNKYNNWERLVSVIEWANMTVNAFALHIGLQRSENLYNIKKGNYGISFELADRICALFPEIDHTWLMSGVGTMLRRKNDCCNEICCYNENVEELLADLGSVEPVGKAYIPGINGCDIAIRSRSRAMCDKQCAATQLFLKHLDSLDDVVQGNEYVLIINGEVLWRKIRIARSEDKWRLVARNRKEFADIYVDRADVTDAWRVIARLAIMTS